jgi:hypothetical protein
VLDEFPPSDRFDRAVKIARVWFEHVGIGATTKPVTVLDACNDRVALIRETIGDKAADDLAARYRRWVEEDSIRKIELMKLTREHIKGFKRRLTAAMIEKHYGHLRAEVAASALAKLAL